MPRCGHGFRKQTIKIVQFSFLPYPISTYRNTENCQENNELFAPETLPSRTVSSHSDPSALRCHTTANRRHCSTTTILGDRHHHCYLVFKYIIMPRAPLSLPFGIQELITQQDVMNAAVDTVTH